MANKEVNAGLIITLGILAIIIFSVMTTVSWGVGKYNTFVIARQDIDNQWSNVKTEYQRRADLIGNMAEVTQAYAKFEKDTLVQVTQARGGNFGSTKAEQMDQMNSLDSAISRLLVVFEKYPELKSIEQYNRLSAELQRTENRVQISRTDYNSLVRSYNILVEKFPNSVLAGWFGYKPEQFFESQKGTEDAPKLNMGG
jgi:LemA protein